MNDDAATISKRLLQAWNKRDLDAFVECLTEDVVWYDPAMPAPPARGRSDVKAFAETVLTAFPDFSYEIREPICLSMDRQRCVIPWRITATASGWMRPPGFAPTGQRIEFEGVDLLDCHDGKIARIETHFDPIAAAERLLSMKLRFSPKSFRARILVLLQRARAFWLRRRK